MKTRERIQKAALVLFNQEGEPNVSTVDIANEVGISPGNLYYHFRGKEAIITELFGSFEEEMHIVLNAPTDSPLSIKDNWLYLYIIFEEIFDFRFFYRNLSDILARYPDIAGRFRKLLILKERALSALLRAMAEADFIVISGNETENLAQRITLLMTYWLNFENIRTPGRDGPELIHQGVYMILTNIAPFVSAGREEFTALVEAFYEGMSANP